MNRLCSVAFRVAGVMFASALMISGLSVASGQEGNPFALQPAPPLPAGMTGSTTNDPRVGLKAGMFDAGEAAMGM